MPKLIESFNFTEEELIKRAKKVLKYAKKTIKMA